MGGSVTGGDDHIWTGDPSLLSGGRWRDLYTDPDSVLGKRPASTISDARDTSSSRSSSPTPPLDELEADLPEHEVRSFICLTITPRL